MRFVGDVSEPIRRQHLGSRIAPQPSDRAMNRIHPLAECRRRRIQIRRDGLPPPIRHQLHRLEAVIVRRQIDEHIVAAELGIAGRVRVRQQLIRHEEPIVSAAAGQCVRHIILEHGLSDIGIHRSGPQRRRSQWRLRSRLHGQHRVRIMRRAWSQRAIDDQNLGVRIGGRDARDNAHDFVVDPRQKVCPRRHLADVARRIERRRQRRGDDEPRGSRGDVFRLQRIRGERIDSPIAVVIDSQDDRARRRDLLPPHLAVRGRCQPEIAHVVRSAEEIHLEFERCADQQVVATTAIEHVPSKAADQHIGSRAADQRVVAQSANQQVVTVATIEPIRSDSTQDGIVAASAEHGIIAGKDGDLVVAGPQIKPLVELAPRHPVVATQRGHDHAVIARHRQRSCDVKIVRQRTLIADRRRLLQSKATGHAGQVNDVGLFVPHDDHSPHQRRR